MTEPTGKVGLVTGGSGGIGAAIGRRLADEVVDLVVAVLRNGYVTGHVFSVDGGMHPG